MPTGTDKPTSIPERLATVAASLGRLQKAGHNDAQNYDYLKEADLVDALRPLLLEQKLFLQQEVTAHERHEPAPGKAMFVTGLDLQYTWIAFDTGETLGPLPWYAQGADTGDKGAYKATTGGLKYFLMRTFLVSTGDDPEGDKRVDHDAAAASARRGTRVQRGSQTGVERGGKSSETTNAQTSRIGTLAKESASTSPT